MKNLKNSYRIRSWVKGCKDNNTERTTKEYTIEDILHTIVPVNFINNNNKNNILLFRRIMF